MKFDLSIELEKTRFKERINYIFDEFELVYISVSGGKDSSVLVQLANIEAKKLKKLGKPIWHKF